MTYSINHLTEDLQALGIREGGVLLVHSSLRSLGKVEGGAETVVQALLNVLGDDGTLLMPALSFATVSVLHPAFDARHTPSCVGALTEYFRTREGTIRSLHPTHSVTGTGRYAQAILSNHQHDTTPCGKHSPFHLLPEYRGQILFIGCGLRPNTSMHAIEELSEPPYLYSFDSEYDITDANGNQFKMRVKNHDFLGYEQRYDRLANILDAPALRRSKVLKAECHLVDAAAMWEAAHAKYQEEPLYFVDRIESE